MRIWPIIEAEILREIEHTGIMLLTLLTIGSSFFAAGVYLIVICAYIGVIPLMAGLYLYFKAFKFAKKRQQEEDAEKSVLTIAYSNAEKPKEPSLLRRIITKIF